VREIRDMEAFAESQNAVEEIYAERRRQVDSEGWSLDHDDEHCTGELALAAAVYAAQAGLLWATTNSHREAVKWLWPFAGPPKLTGDPRRMLIKAGALIVAEIERLDRRAASGDSVEEGGA